MEFIDFQSTHEMVKRTVDGHASETAYRWIFPSGETESVTWEQFYEELQRVSKSLIAHGVEKGDKICILSYTCYRWVVADLATSSIGSCAAGIYHSLLPKDCRHIINHSDSVIVFAEDQHQLDKLFEIRQEIPNVRKVVLFKGDGGSDPWVSSWEDFLEVGSKVGADAFSDRVAQVNSLDPAAIVYTSGTTGVPKGAVLTHDNLTFTAQSIENSGDFRDGEETLLFLPLAHVYARACVLLALSLGCPTTFARGLDTLLDDFNVARPHWFASVPRVYEKVYSKILSGAEAKGGVALKIFRWACSVGAEVSDHKVNKRPVPFLTDLKYSLATKLVFSKVHEALGGRVRWCISGAAPLNPDIGKFFHAAGVLILEGIGMTENTSFTNVNRYDNYRFGWVGPTGPGIEQRTTDEGEVMYRGRNVMKEYYKMPNETAETITEDGWQYTGDLGEIDSEGFLRITGRKKDLIVTAGGKNVAPSAIEGSIATSKFISQVCVIGDRRKYLTALLALDPDNIRDYAMAHGITTEKMEDIVQDERILQLINAELTEKNKEFASFETIKKFRIVDEFTIENGMLTPTLKIKRNVALERYVDLIEEMYVEG